MGWFCLRPCGLITWGLIGRREKSSILQISTLVKIYARGKNFEGPLVFCGSKTRGIVGVEESQDRIHSADSTLGKGPCDIRAC